MPNLIAALLPFVAALLALSTLRLACAAPVAHAHYVSSRQRYCAAFSGGNFTYSPLYLPHGVGLLHTPPQLDERALDMHTYLPVLHTSMGGSNAGRVTGRGIPFYYLAPGCSDMYIRAGRTLLAHNRVHALLRLLHDDAPRTAAALNADCAKKINSTGRPAIVSVRTLALATPDVSQGAPGLRARHRVGVSQFTGVPRAAGAGLRHARAQLRGTRALRELGA